MSSSVAVDIGTGTPRARVVVPIAQNCRCLQRRRQRPADVPNGFRGQSFALHVLNPADDHADVQAVYRGHPDWSVQMVPHLVAVPAEFRSPPLASMTAAIYSASTLDA